ncbi:MAG: SLBB domain-containing protein [Syntrophaceae bacterium]|nr:SLBB domain-containing protein [Syntrophaceae bacterium]
MKHFNRLILFSLISLLVSAQLIFTGCARYRELPPGAVKDIRSAGFEGVDITDLQKTELKTQAASIQITDGTSKESVKLLSTSAEDKEFTSLKPFGYEFFNKYPIKQTGVKSDSKEGMIIPVSKQYRLSQGDEINIFLEGKTKRKYNLIVDSSGKIDIPGVGSVFVVGMTFEEMSKEVIKKVERTTSEHVDVSMRARNTITVYFRGEVPRPMPHVIGAYSTVTEALKFVGGPKDSGSLREIQVRRKGITVAYFDLYEFLLKGIKYKDITLMNGDEIIVLRKGPEVAVEGNVNRPGVYEMKGRYDLDTLIALAGGVIAEKKDLRIQVRRLDGNERRIVYDINDKEINLKKADAPILVNRDIVQIVPFTDKTVLADVDTKTIPPKDELAQPEPEAVKDDTIPLQNFVTLTGEFVRPGRYTIQKGEKISSVIERAGGYTNHAYLRGAHFTRESIKKIQQEKLKEIAQRVEKELFPRGIAQDGIQLMYGERQLKRHFVEYIQSLKPTGRLTVNIAHLRLLKNSPHDIEMEEGDHLHIPQRSNIVNTIGSVLTEKPHIYNGGWDYREYIDASGGYSRAADEPSVFAIKVDGSIRKLYRPFIRWSDNNERWELTAFSRKINQIEAGDVIVIPGEPNNVVWLRQLKDINPLIMNTAVLSGTVLKIY